MGIPSVEGVPGDGAGSLPPANGVKHLRGTPLKGREGIPDRVRERDPEDVGY